MNIAVHLVSAPWSQPYYPSIQLAALKAYIDEAFARRVAVHAYSAFLAVPHRAAGAQMFEFYEKASAAGEHAYMAIFLAQRWNEVGGRGRFPTGSVLRALKDSRTRRSELTRPMLRQLRLATESYIDDVMAPAFTPGAINLIGLSLNYDQVYSSLYMARYIQDRYSQFRPAFLFGGYSASVPHVVELLYRLKAPGCLLIGEGEKKLELIIQNVLAAEDVTAAGVDSIVAASCAGVYEVRANTQIFERRSKDYATQFDGMLGIPLPDHGEYFRTLATCTDNAETFQLLAARQSITIEGSRGCFAKCDFCGLNSTWQGFRKSTPERVLAQTVELASRHLSTRFSFVDNVCDTWAEKFADLLLSNGMRIHAFYELRAHHPESYWTKLALSGATQIQIGVESLSQPLLTHIGKGTRVIQNVAAQKYLAELKIEGYGNILTDHPMSTVEDIAETRRVLEQCPHLGVFELSRYRMASGSPLYDNLSIEEKKALKPCVETKLPRAVMPYALEFFSETPTRLACGPEVKRAWQRFRAWFAKFAQIAQGRKATLEVTRLAPGRLLIVDRRGARVEHHVLEGDAAAVYDACHAGPRLQNLPALVSLDAERAMAVVESLLQKRVLLRIEDSVLSIALRPRDELVHNLYRKIAQADIKHSKEPVAHPQSTERLVTLHTRAAS